VQSNAGESFCKGTICTVKEELAGQNGSRSWKIKLRG
jgi:hypothetical protein